jgi:hypothetical protein
MLCLIVACAPRTTTTLVTSYDPDFAADAYVYLLGRALVARQEAIDIGTDGIEYNKIHYNKLGSADFPNPNLDVAYLEAWIAVDDKTAALLEIPKIEGRYYTAQICDEWGEVIVNINERTFPDHPCGKYALVAPGSTAEIPAGVPRIELHSRKAKMLARVELRDDVEGAVRLQRQFKLSTLGEPKSEPAVRLAAFDMGNLIGIELFDAADALLDSARDVSPVAKKLRVQVESVAAYAATGPEKRGEIDGILRENVIPRFLKYAVTEAGSFKNNWLGTLTIGNYGEKYWVRTSANLVGIWANASDEVIYFVSTRDAEGRPLDGSNKYLLDFGPVGDPAEQVNAYWSVILVDLSDYRVVPNRLNRFNFNTYSKLDRSGGSLRLHVSAKPDPDQPESNWLPAQQGKPFSLTFRTYVPRDTVKRGEWFPPALKRVE